MKAPIPPWPVYNPALLPSACTTLASSLRRPLAERLLALLERAGPRAGDQGAPQHQLVLGAPGSGKTMLLRALQSAIAHTPKLDERWIPLTFPEAQWDVARPADFWENALDYLVIALRRADRGLAPGHLDQLEADIGAIRALADEDARGPRALALLTRTGKQLGCRFVLLVDTLDIVLERLKRDEWHVREALASEPRVLLIGTSSRAIEATFRYDAAFYDFFQIHELRPLPRVGLADALRDVHADDPLVCLRARAERDPTAIAAVLDLVGSQPRTLALLGTVLASRPDAPPGELVMALLDLATPHFRARIDGLAPQSQQVVRGLAAAWHPVRPQELSTRTRLAPNVVSAQLHRLVSEGIVDKAPLPRSLRHGFLLADRQLQVWLLMRMGQPHRRRLALAAEHLHRAHRGEAVGLVAELFDPSVADVADPDVALAVAPELRALLTGELRGDRP